MITNKEHIEQEKICEDCGGTGHIDGDMCDGCSGDGIICPVCGSTLDSDGSCLTCLHQVCDPEDMNVMEV